jgi:Flp pilus assembly protein TadG
VIKRSERGQTAVEFALVIPVMMLFLLGIFQIGTTFFNREALATSARDGTRAGAIHTGATLTQIQNYVYAAVKSSGVGLDTPKIQYLPAPYCDPTPACAAGDTLHVTVTYPWKLGIMGFAKRGTLSTTTSLRME